MTAARFLPLRASAGDPRFSWCADEPGRTARAAVVLVHGSDRDPVGLVREFRPWARERGLALVAPLFPGGIPRTGDHDAYKSALGYTAAPGYTSAPGGELRFDGVLDDILTDAAAEMSLDPSRFALFGFSGGAQFAHRFALLHPTRIRALCLAAPGNVTLLAPGRHWWAGVDDLASLTGSPVDMPALARVPVLAMVGGDDDGREAIHVAGDEPRWVPGANDAGVTRGERLAALAADWCAAGVDVTTRVLDGVGHELAPFVAPAQRFLDRHLSGHGVPG